MLVFIDESGDAGFDLKGGSSPVFAVGMVIFRQVEVANSSQELIRNAAQNWQQGREFKFNKCDDERRDAFFQLVARCDFRVRAMVIQKERIRSDKLRSEPESFYSFFLKSMLRFDNDLLRNAKIVIDGSGNAMFKSKLKKYISANTSPGAIKNIVMRDSHREPLLQLADMSIGAIARSYRTERNNCDRWRIMLRSKIDDVWDFR